ncbi:MAG: formylmethanofuran dehydrogenase subunit B [Candidatus Thiodiazotropha sp.]
MWNNEIGQITNAVTCPCCGLSCDDLQVEVNDGRLQSLDKGCVLARAFFDDALGASNATPRLKGQQASLDDALARSAELLENASAPLFTGLATDVNGMRATLALADRCGASLDHLNGDALFRNIRVVQDNGWFTTTLTEVRNRADLILLAGSQATERFPRLVERVLNPGETLFTAAGERRLVLLGPWDDDALPDEVAAMNPMVIPLDIEQVTDAVGLLRGLLAGRPVEPGSMGEDTGSRLTALAESLQAAKYSVIAWSAAEFDYPHAELTIQGLADLAKDLNLATRCAALPLAGTLADITSNQVCTWQLGYPLRSRLTRGYPEHDPALNRWQDLLARGETDLLLWISALSPQAVPPRCDCPSIVLGHAGMVFETEPDVYIPVGVPGVDHPGHWYRSDSVCPLPLGQLRDAGLPAVGKIINTLTDRLRQTAGT